MVKILTYINKSGNAFTRDRGHINAEVELDQLTQDGWAIESASTSDMVTGGFGGTTSFTRLTVILKKTC